MFENSKPAMGDVYRFTRRHSSRVQNIRLLLYLFTKINAPYVQ